jgi:hypothetical protein
MVPVRERIRQYPQIAPVKVGHEGKAAWLGGQCRPAMPPGGVALKRSPGVIRRYWTLRVVSRSTHPEEFSIFEDQNVFAICRRQG